MAKQHLERKSNYFQWDENKKQRNAIFIHRMGVKKNVCQNQVLAKY